MPRSLLAFVLGCFSAITYANGDEQSDFFEAKIRPVLVSKCYNCHSDKAEKIGGELLLDSRDRMRRGGESGQLIEDGKPDASLLIEAIRYEGLEMPPSGKLPDRVIADFEQWVRSGAFDPRGDARKANDTSAPAVDIESGREFWSFQPPKRHPAPEVAAEHWVQRPIDRFILSRLEQSGIEPSEPADRKTLIRRLTFDLIGLPPTPNEVESFVNDNRPDAYRQLIERLMASPQFGVRWASLWLGVARYAEDQAHIVGDNSSLFYPNAHLYRKWVIEAFNDDMRYDDFVRLQLAADQMGESAKPHTAALGFLGLGPKYYRRNAPEVMADEWEDRVDTVTRGLLGLTVACARCHDHKYDPIPTEDYYALAGVFASTQMHNQPLPDWKPSEKKKKPEPKDALHIVREGKARDLKVQIRGDAFNEGVVVPRRFPQVLADEEIPLRDGSGRVQLAEAIVSPDNPLTARVIVNRIWGQYFGRSLVATPSNLGKLGARPTHPQLLDDLAVRFVESGWSLKWLHREIVMSATYQQSSYAQPAVLEIDPANELLGRMPRRRLSIEMWRDSILAVAGQLQLDVAGRSFEVQDPRHSRRTAYGKVSRLELDSVLQLFDFPDPNVHAAKRAETTTPLQKLFALNSPFMVSQAEQLAKRLLQQSDDLAQRVQHAHALLYARKATSEELTLAADFIQSRNGEDAWAQYAQVLLASNELMFLD